MTDYTIRKNCIFCNSELLNNFFENDYSIPLAIYNKYKNNKDAKKIPFNVLCCQKCFTYQIKYLGNINEVYDNNNADNCGSIRTDMNDEFAIFIKNNINDINSILEVGAGSGSLSTSILNYIQNINYTILEPFYFGIKENRNIINDYIENVDLTSINTNILIMSHVFEHFYEPLKIIEKIANSKNIEYVCLNHPDLENNVKNNSYNVNVLNLEHTYYIENNFLKTLFLKYGFELIAEQKYKEYSILLIFKRTYDVNNEIVLKNEKSVNDITIFYNGILNKVNKINNLLTIIDNNIDIHIFPCSYHTSYLFVFGLKANYFKSILDNSTTKINKYLNSYDIICESCNDFLENNKKSIVVLNGGCFNNELNLNKASNIIFLT